MWLECWHEDYTLFRRDSPDSAELCLGEDDELMGQDKTADYCCCGCLLPDQEEKVKPSTGSMEQPQSHRPWFFWGTWLPWHLLNQHSETRTAQKAPGKHGWQFPDTGSGGSPRQWCAAQPILTNREGLAGGVTMRVRNSVPDEENAEQ